MVKLHHQLQRWLVSGRRGPREQKTNWPYLVSPMGEVHANNIESSYILAVSFVLYSSNGTFVPLRKRLIFSTEFVLGPEHPLRQPLSDLRMSLGHDILSASLPIVQMMELRRKFFAGRNSVLSPDSHSKRVRLAK